MLGMVSGAIGYEESTNDQFVAMRTNGMETMPTYYDLYLLRETDRCGLLTDYQLQWLQYVLGYLYSSLDPITKCLIQLSDWSPHHPRVPLWHDDALANIGMVWLRYTPLERYLDTIRTANVIRVQMLTDVTVTPCEIESTGDASASDTPQVLKAASQSRKFRKRAEKRDRKRLEEEKLLNTRFVSFYEYSRLPRQLDKGVLICMEEYAVLYPQMLGHVDDTEPDCPGWDSAGEYPVF